MQLSAPGPLWYKAVLMSVAPGVGGTLTGSYQVIDAAGDYHNGLALDGVTVQMYLDVSFDPANLLSARAAVEAAKQRLFIMENGGSLSAVAQACIDQGVPW